MATVAVGVFISLGLWQLRRLDERRELNDMIEERASQDAEPLGDLIEEHGGDAEDLVWRMAIVAGTYVGDAQVQVVGRSLGGVSGVNVVTPLLLADDEAIVVNRGWVPIDDQPPSPTSGRVTVTGVLRGDEGSGLLGGGSSDGASLSRIDLTRIEADTGLDLLPVYLQLADQVPAADPPTPMPLPEIGEGPHLSYAVQWFLFAAIVIIGFPVLVWRSGGAVTPRLPPSTPSSEP